MSGDREHRAAALPWRNWDGGQRAVASAVLAPSGVDDVIALVKDAAATGHTVKVVGSGHSFTGIARTDDRRVEMHRMAGLVSADLTAKTVTVEAGMPMRALNATLAGLGLALANLGDIDAQTVAGAVATGTHGTGTAHATLSSLVRAVTLVDGTGELRRVDADSPLFGAVRLGLGALGIVTELTLQCVDAFVLRTDERPMPMAQVLTDLPEHLASNDHAEFYWFPYTDLVQLKRNNVVPAHDRPLTKFRGWIDDELLANRVFGGLCRLGRAVPAVVPAINRLSVRGLAARTFTGPSHAVFCSPRRVRFTEMEYAIPRESLGEALTALRRITESLPFKVQFPVEVRFTGPDDVWLSHGYGRQNAYVAIHQFVGAPYRPYLERFEAVCERLGGCPHWGKLHYRDAESLRPAYPRFDDFLAARDELDPGRVFTNAYLDRVLGP